MGEKVRVAIVGSGPAGLSAAARAAELGMSHVLLEKTDHLSDTIYKYQKGKHIMATPSNLVLRSDLDFEAGKRETILDTWSQQTGAHEVNIMLRAEVIEITGAAGDFQIKLKTGESVAAEAVVLAIGTQGNPNLVRCPTAEGTIVQYQLDDAGEYVDEHITVIGGGDAGIENAMGLAADPQQNNTVTIVNRSADFATAKEANVQALLAMEADGRITVRRETTASAIGGGEIVFDTRDGEVKVPCNRVIARMGSAPPRAFVEGIAAEFEEPSRPGKRFGQARHRRPVHQRRPGRLPGADPDLRSDRARHPRHRRAGGLSADQALHEPGPRRHRVPERQHGAEAGRRADPGGEIRQPAGPPLGRRMARDLPQPGGDPARAVAAPDARADARFERRRVPRRRRGLHPQRARLVDVRDRRRLGGGRGRSERFPR